MSKDIRKKFDECFSSIGQDAKQLTSSQSRIVNNMHYLLNNDAPEILDCKVTELINFIDHDEESELTLYRLLNQARIEVDVEVPPNTFRQSWTRKMSSAANKLKLEPDARKNFLIQVHEQSERIAGDDEEVNMNHIEAAIEYSTALITPTRDVSADTQELQINTELVSSLLLEVRHPSVSKRMITIKHLLKSSDELNVLFKKLTSLPEAEREELHALIQSDCKLKAALK